MRRKIKQLKSTENFVSNTGNEMLGVEVKRSF